MLVEVELWESRKDNPKDPPGYFSRGWVESGRAPLAFYPGLSLSRTAAFATHRSRTLRRVLPKW